MPTTEDNERSLTTGARAAGRAAGRLSAKRQERKERKAAEEANGPQLDTMTLVEHLTELRRRIVISLVAIAAGAVVGFILYNRALAFLVHPYCKVVKDIGAKTIGGEGNCGLLATSPLDGFSIRLKIATYGGLALASPVVLFQLWRFITPGLHPREKRYAVPFVVSSIVLFLGGCVVAWITFVPALKFLIGIGGHSLVNSFTPEKYINLILLMLVAFGATFEFPVVIVMLEIANVLTPRKLLGWWRAAIVVIVIIAAVVTPSQDPVSLLAMSIPMVVFYFASIGIGKLLGK